MEQNKSVENQATTPVCKSFKDMVGQPFGEEYKIAKSEMQKGIERATDIDKYNIDGLVSPREVKHSMRTGAQYTGRIPECNSEEDANLALSNDARLCNRASQKLFYEDGERASRSVEEQAHKDALDYASWREGNGLEAERILGEMSAPKELKTLNDIAEGKAEPMSELDYDSEPAFKSIRDMVGQPFGEEYKIAKMRYEQRVARDMEMGVPQILEAHGVIDTYDPATKDRESDAGYARTLLRGNNRDLGDPAAYIEDPSIDYSKKKDGENWQKYSEDLQELSEGATPTVDAKSMSDDEVRVKTLDDMIDQDYETPIHEDAANKLAVMDEYNRRVDEKAAARDKAVEGVADQAGKTRA